MSLVVDTIGVPLDLGANIRGANMGPSAVRNAGLNEAIRSLGHDVHESGDVDVPLREQLTNSTFEAKYFEEIYSACSTLYKKVEDALTNRRFPLTIGGDHSIAVGSISASSDNLREKGGDLGLIWVDAHADMNTIESSKSGNIHGMPLASIIGLGDERFAKLGTSNLKVKPDNVVLIGIRDLDPLEQKICKNSGVRYYTMRDLDQRGMANIITEELERLSKSTAGLHLSFDLDAVDPSWAPGVSTPVSGGLTYREVETLLSLLAKESLVSMDFVELNARFDQQQMSAKSIVQWIKIVLGQAII